MPPTSTIPLPEVLQKSCLNAKSYPSNYTLKSLSTYPTALKVWRNRLRDNAGEMFRKPGSTVDIPYRDLNSGRGMLSSPDFFLSSKGIRIDMYRA